MKKTIEIISIGLIFLGLAISLLETIEWLPNPRLELANKIMNLGKGTLPLETPYVDKLLLFFLSPKTPKVNKNNLNESLRGYEGIVIKDILIDGRNAWGSVYIQKKNSDKVGIICGF